MKRNFICTTKNGTKVYYDPVGSHAATHLEDTPQLMDLVIEILTDEKFTEDKVMFYKHMDRIVGTCDVVSVGKSDKIVYAIRKNRTDDGHVPFTTSRPAEPCPYVTICLQKQPDGSYILESTWIGTFTQDDEPFPNSPLATERSIAFWSDKAFVWGSQEIQAGTLRDDCPW